ncbi:hypothetical protein SBA4_6270002 [Candidatus Sulfopaludibacter sp. SbA4]|nr:hypothetical protein SBA4_6270002 [Candidatus Sulfopaludibacter sp. SbA4]
MSVCFSRRFKSLCFFEMRGVLEIGGRRFRVVFTICAPALAGASLWPTAGKPGWGRFIVMTVEATHDASPKKCKQLKLKRIAKEK